MSILSKKIIYVEDIDDEREYKCRFSRSGHPYYIPESESIPQVTLGDDNSYIDYLFIPIDESEFSLTNNRYAYGYRIIIKVYENSYLVSINPSMENSEINIKIGHEVRRVRFYIIDEDTICIDRENDPMFPSNIVELSCKGELLIYNIHVIIEDVIDFYCSYYIDKII